MTAQSRYPLSVSGTGRDYSVTVVIGYDDEHGEDSPLADEPVAIHVVDTGLDKEQAMRIGEMLRADWIAMNNLVDFTRTPEWSVSMLEDIAEIVKRARPYVKDLTTYEPEDEWAWQSH